jgi:dUTP pyrophosphatase
MDIKFFRYKEQHGMASCGDNRVVVKVIPESTEFIPAFQTKESAGADIRSSIDVTLFPLQVEVVPAGFRCKIPEGYHAKILSRSSMGKKGIIIPNQPGLIDSDYTDEIKVLLLNLGKEPYTIKRGDRIAQWLLEKNMQYSWQQVEEIEDTERKGGFGSTGTK